MPRAAPPAPPPRTCTSAAPRPDATVSSLEQDITPVRNPAHPARQPGRHHAPRPSPLSVTTPRSPQGVRRSANYLISLALAGTPSTETLHRSVMAPRLLYASRRPSK